MAVKGQDRDTALILSVSKADTGGKRRGLRVWNVSGPVAKMELYRWLKLEREHGGIETPPGTCHFPEYGEEYFKQLTAERRVIRLHKGFPRATWEKDPSRNNEALDCRVYARAAATIYGLDRMSQFKWHNLEQALGVEVEVPTQGVEMPVTPASATQVSMTEKTATSSAEGLKPESLKFERLMTILKQRKAIHSDDPYLAQGPSPYLRPYDPS